MMPHPVRVIIAARPTLPVVCFDLSFVPEGENHEGVEDEEEREEIQEEGYNENGEEHVVLKKCDLWRKVLRWAGNM
jgi:hypothetical protein